MPAQSMAPTVLITRPAAQSASFAQSLRAQVPEVRVVVSPLMATVFHAVTLPEGPLQGVILTSQTGAEASAKTLHEKENRPMPRDIKTRRIKALCDYSINPPDHPG